MNLGATDATVGTSYVLLLRKPVCQSLRCSAPGSLQTAGLALFILHIPVLTSAKVKGMNCDLQGLRDRDDFLLTLSW